jgi:hypothetical protein
MGLTTEDLKLLDRITRKGLNETSISFLYAVFGGFVIGIVATFVEG